jgi:hypothetical protein
MFGRRPDRRTRSSFSLRGDLASLILGFVLSTLYGAFFHFWRGGGSGRLVLYLVLSWTGFLAGHFAAVYMNINIDKIGELHVGLSSLGSIVFIIIGYWLSLGGIVHMPQK